MRIVHSLDELWEALQEGADPADMDHGDGIWRDNNPDQARAADLATYRDHERLLRTGGQLD